MAERVFGVVGREVVVVEAAPRAPAGGVATARLEPQPYFAGHVALRLLDERFERAHQRRVPQAVVDELGDADLDALLLARDVAFERDAFEVLMRVDERQRRRALVDLAALDADAPVLDHVDAAPAVGADRRRPSASMSSTRSGSSPSRLTGTPASNPTTTSRGSSGASFGARA